MCNLYRLTRPRDEVGAYFNAVNEMAGANLGEDVYPGYPGVVIADGKLRQMTWGFPLQMKDKQGQPLKPKPVNNTRTDKLDSFFWRYSFEERRCLIPLTAWAEAEGANGEDPNLVERARPADLCVRRYLALERRMGRCIFDGHD